MHQTPVTLTRHLIEQQAVHPAATGEFSTIMAQLALAGKIISRELGQAGLTDVLGLTGETNVQGEQVQKLDKRANETFVRVFEYYGGLVKALVSEEMEKPWEVGGYPSTERPHGKYVIFLDPLDGSSNLDGNLTVGSIFSVHRYQPQVPGDLQGGLLKPGAEQVAAGYLLYGPSTLLVYTSGAGVYQFTLDPGIGEFVLSRSRIKMPARGKVYSANESNIEKWPQGVQRFVAYLREKDPASGRPYSSRYSGCLVADVHRFLSNGGIYLYPGEANKPEGKLRLMYEAAPLAFVIEQAGGSASTGTQKISEIRPTTVHQRVPLIIGSIKDVSTAEAFIQGKR
ncbi:class 1 fructose-bisphosphatase [Candidatus Nitrospira bockiana]